jgi:hypothetical protein
VWDHHEIPQSREFANHPVIQLLDFKIQAANNRIYLPGELDLADMGLTLHPGGPLSSYPQGIGKFLDSIQNSPEFKLALGGDLDAHQQLAAELNFFHDTVKVALVNGDLYTNAPAGMTRIDANNSNAAWYADWRNYGINNADKIGLVNSILEGLAAESNPNAAKWASLLGPGRLDEILKNGNLSPGQQADLDVFVGYMKAKGLDGHLFSALDPDFAQWTLPGYNPQANFPPLPGYTAEANLGPVPGFSPISIPIYLEKYIPENVPWFQENFPAQPGMLPQSYQIIPPRDFFEDAAFLASIVAARTPVGFAATVLGAGLRGAWSTLGGMLAGAGASAGNDPSAPFDPFFTNHFTNLDISIQLDWSGWIDLNPPIFNIGANAAPDFGNFGWDFTIPGLGPNPFAPTPGWDDYNWGNSGNPVILDLDGRGFNITPLSQSATFLDAAGDGDQHRTAWAGPGDGVLMIDVNGNGTIDAPEEFQFTLWDPTAASDLEALAHVFDTDHDGTLDAGDARFGQFKVLVTNPDGTTTMKTLAQLGIASIGLTPDHDGRTLPDGSRILGSTTFSRTDGTTGAAADVSLAYDARGYAVTRTETHNADGTVTIDVKTFNPDGSLSGEMWRTGATDGSSSLAVDSDGDGIIDDVQGVAVTFNPDGSRSETWSRQDVAGLLLERTITTTFADPRHFTILRDTDHNGTFEQAEAHAVATDGGTTCTISDLNPSGSVRHSVTYTTSADGLSTTTDTDVSGDGLIDAHRTDVTVLGSDGKRKRTVSDSSRNGTLTGHTVTETSADGRSVTTKTDRDGDGTIDLTDASSIVVAADGSSVATQRLRAGNDALIAAAVTTLSANGLTRRVESDLDGNGTIDHIATDVVTLSGDGSRNETATAFNADGSMRSRVATGRSADGRSRFVDIDANGDTHLDTVETVAVQADGSSVDTLALLNPNGSLRARTVTTTSADGRTSTVQMDRDGNGTIDLTRVQATTALAGGGSINGTTDYNGDGSLAANTVVTVNADGRVTTTQQDVDGDGHYDRTETDIVVVNANGSITETVEERSANGTLTGRTVTTTSADRNSVTVAHDFSGDGAIDRVESTVRNSTGSVVANVTNLSRDGVARSGTVTTTTPDWLATTVQVDSNGDGVLDHVQTTGVVLGADGSRSETVEERSANGMLLNRTVTTVSANGLSTRVQSDVDGDNVFDLTRSDVTVLKPDGGREQTITDSNVDGSLRARTVTTLSANGLSTKVQTDRDGNGVFDLTRSDVTVLNANGGTTETVEDRSTNNTLIGRTVTTTSADGATVRADTDLNGDGVIDRTVTTAVNGDGSRVTTAWDYSTGALRSRSIATVSADGLATDALHDLDGNGSIDLREIDVTVRNANGSTTRTTSGYNGMDSLRYRSVVTTSGNGLTTTAQYDNDGDGVFDLTRINTISLGGDGSRTERFEESSAGSLRQSIVTTVSRDGNTETVERDRDGNGSVDQRRVTTHNLNGSVTVVGAGFIAGVSPRDQVVTTTSADGRSTVTQYDFDGNGIVDRTRNDTIILNANGSTTEVIDNTRPGAPIDHTEIITSANGGRVETRWELDGDGTIDGKRIDDTV